MMTLFETSRMVAFYVAAAVCEIAGCFALWAVLRMGKSIWWIAPGVLALAVFATLLTRIDVALAGRAFAAYGGIYILMSLGWLWVVEKQIPNRTDLFGAALCLIGALVILTGRHSLHP